MAFNPGSDVILEVLNAADPLRASLAADRLAALAGAKAPEGDFAASLDRAASSTPSPASPIEGLADARAGFTRAAEGTDQSSRVKVEFEAMALNSFVGELLPKETSGFFGAGATGEMWRSMLAEQIARQIAKLGSLGLSRRLFATHDLATAHSGDLSAARDPALTSDNILSAPADADLARGAVLSAGRKRA